MIPEATTGDQVSFSADLFGNPIEPPAHGPKLSDEFLYPPFSVWNAREGWWQERKAAWLTMGIEGEKGRGTELLYGDRMGETNYYSASTGTVRNTSIFDPVVCELACRWFSPPSGLVLDPFAGGSVRGVVAGRLGLRYRGIELRHEQVEANREQALEICPRADVGWAAGDARNMAAYPVGPRADLVFTCPPYGDLERYSDDPRDLSTLTWGQFAASYGVVLERCAERPADNRFAVFVVGNYRAKDGGYRDLVGETVRRCEAVGLRYYNEAVLVTAAGSLPLRAGRAFRASRKLGKTHQNVLVFVKGNWRKAAAACREEGYPKEV